MTALTAYMLTSLVLCCLAVRIARCARRELA